jgi:hypothetical protein
MAHSWRTSILRIMSTVHALRYRWAAQRDEKKGFPLTAAMEWREAADLFAPIAPLAERCWREWERIMRLPRRLAEPIG